jgi:hypothetical protein
MHLGSRMRDDRWRLAGFILRSANYENALGFKQNQKDGNSSILLILNELV